MSKQRRSPPQGPFLCYALTDAQRRRSYTGQTNNFARRIRQHNGELAGGARYTSRHKVAKRWSPLFKVCGFATLRSVLQFEWAMKKRRGAKGARSGPKGRVRQLEHILAVDGGKYVSALHNYVECHLLKAEYLRWSGLSEEEFDSRRKRQGVVFKFTCT